MFNTRHAVKILILMCLTALSFIFLPATCFASWTGIGLRSSSGEIICPVTPDTPVDVDSSYVSVPGCSVTIGDGNHVPRRERYRLLLAMIDTNGFYETAIRSDLVLLDPGDELNTLSINWPISATFTPRGHYVHICYMLEDSVAHYYTFNNTPQGCLGSGGGTPLPSPFHCAFGDGNTLNISLGDVDRTEIGAVPGTLPGTEKDINITCTGDGTATYTIGFQYTAINIAGTEMISSTANGLAVAMSLNDEPVSPTDTFTRTYSAGTQTEKLTFEPVRDPSVKIGDIPTGAFSANAVMVLTVQ